LIIGIETGNIDSVELNLCKSLVGLGTANKLNPVPRIQLALF